MGPIYEFAADLYRQHLKVKRLYNLEKYHFCQMLLIVKNDEVFKLSTEVGIPGILVILRRAMSVAS